MSPSVQAYAELFLLWYFLILILSEQEAGGETVMTLTYQTLDYSEY